MTSRPITALLLPLTLAACMTPSADIVATRYHFGWVVPASGDVTSVFDDGSRTYVILRDRGAPVRFSDDAGLPLVFRHVAPYYVIDGVRPAFWIVRGSQRLHITLPQHPADSPPGGSTERPATSGAQGARP